MKGGGACARPSLAPQPLDPVYSFHACCMHALQEVPPGVLTEFEHELEEDLASVAVTLTAVTGVIIFWRGVWSLLDCESALQPVLLSCPTGQQ